MTTRRQKMRIEVTAYLGAEHKYNSFGWYDLTEERADKWAHFAAYCCARASIEENATIERHIIEVLQKSRKSRKDTCTQFTFFTCRKAVYVVNITTTRAKIEEKEIQFSSKEE